MKTYTVYHSKTGAYMASFTDHYELLSYLRALSHSDVRVEES